MNLIKKEAIRQLESMYPFSIKRYTLKGSRVHTTKLYSEAQVRILLDYIYGRKYKNKLVKKKLTDISDSIHQDISGLEKGNETKHI